MDFQGLAAAAPSSIVRPEALADLTVRRAKNKRRVFTKAEIKARYRARHRNELNEKSRVYWKRRNAQNRVPHQYCLELTKKRPVEQNRKHLEKKKLRYRNDGDFRQQCLDRMKRVKARRNEAERRAKREYQRQWGLDKRRTDAFYALKCRLRRRISYAFIKHGYSKKTSCRELLGADFQTVKEHLESTFTEGMSWENRGLWHIDHVIPLAAAKDERRLRELFHYRNLQALWARDNYSKGARHG